MNKRWYCWLVAGGLAMAVATPPALQAQPVAATRPLPGTDPTKVLFEMQDGLGLLRGLEQSDSVARVEYWGTGTLVRNGKPARLSAFKVSLNYETPGMRFDFTSSGQREIQVVAGRSAWNEDTPGGNAVATADAAAERRLLLWLTPIGIAKAAAKAGDALKVTIEGGKTMVSFPVDGSQVRATLNALFEPELVEAHLGNVAHTLSYADYGEQNDNARADVYLPKRILHKVNGATVMDLTVAHSNTYNPYVVMPIPANVKD